MKIVEFKYDNDVFFDESELKIDGFKYFESKRGVSLEEILDFIVDFYNVTGVEGAKSVEETLLNGVRYLPSDIQEEIIEDIEYWTEEEFESVDELIESGYYGEIVDFLESQVESIRLEGWIEDGLLPANDFYSGIVGYSQWAFFIAHKSASKKYIHSIWEGTDFYAILELDETGDVVNSLGWIYIANSLDELLDYVPDVIGDSEFVVVDNEISQYIDVPKVEKIKNITYSFEEVE